ncbi:MAG: outer membrane beta-barrel family protein [Bacteroidales bacterium]|nr:outer membrane beta-barrel family protein [Bacteroidales bacterium]
MKQFTLLIAMLISVVCAHAAIIKGVVVDVDKNPAEFVTVTLRVPQQEDNLTGVTTDLDGHFELPNVAKGTYQINISMVGYNTITRNVTITSDEQIVDLKTLVLKEDARMLDAVEVVGQAGQMHFDIDKAVFNVDQNLAAAGASASEMLQHIPSIDVDQDGEVSLRGSTNVEVWINGKPSGLDADNRAQILQQMPAGSIEKVELITNPSAKYSPEGTAGIINLVLKKDRKAGYYGSVEAGVGYQMLGVPAGNVSANFNYNSSLVDFYINFGFRQRNHSGDGTTDRWAFTPNTNRTDTISYLSQENHDDERGWGIFTRAGVDFHLGKQRKDNLGVNVMFNDGKKNKTETINYSLADYRYNTQALYSRDNTNKSNRLTYNVGLDYQHQFDDKGSELRASVSYSNNTRGSESIYDQIVQEGPAFAYQQNQGSDNNTSRFEFKTDYTQRFANNAKLEAGVAVNGRQTSMNSTTYDGTVADDNSLLSYNDFNYSEWIAALYATYGQKWGSFSAQLGLRGEFFTTTNETRDTPTDAFVSTTRNYWQLYPTIYLSYSLPRDNELQLNYTRRVNRPRGRQLSMYRNVSDSTNVSYGNPDLKPEFSNAVEFKYIKTWDKHNLSASLYYHYTTDIMQNVRFQSDERPNVMESTWDNVAKQQSLGMEMAAMNTVARWLNLTTSLRGSYEDMADVYYRNVLLQERQRRFNWSARIMGNFIFTKTFSGQLSFSYNSPHVIAQGKSKGMFFSSIGLKKSFLDRRLILSLSAFDLFRSMGWKNLTWGDNFYQDMDRQPNGPMINFSVRWTFGDNHGKNRRGMSGEGGGDDMGGYDDMSGGFGE